MARPSCVWDWAIGTDADKEARMTGDMGIYRYRDMGISGYIADDGGRERAI